MAAETIRMLLEENQRPYTVGAIRDGVKGLEKGAVERGLKELMDKGLIGEKVYGKLKVYFLRKDDKKSAKQLGEDLLGTQRHINDLTSKIQENQGKIKATEEQFAKAREKLTMAEACAKKMELQEEVTNIKDALKEFDGVDLVRPDVKFEVQQDYEKYLALYRKRKRLCQDMLDAIRENYPKSKDHLYGAIGIETDESAGFRIETL
ncbi:homologous-pairing protein 2 homolog [Euwallacea fornicatus]|uniref:homologous-pairing protein 2 homolog n=1 Tax=Euwallacea fornicatus TaxID=995702 RepID=UPI00338DB38C